MTHGERKRLNRVVLQIRASAALARIEADCAPDAGAFHVCIRLAGVADSRASSLEAKISPSWTIGTPPTVARRFSTKSPGPV